MDEMSLRQETIDLIEVITMYEKGAPKVASTLRLLRAKRLLEEWLENGEN